MKTFHIMGSPRETTASARGNKEWEARLTNRLTSILCSAPLRRPGGNPPVDFFGRLESLARFFVLSRDDVLFPHAPELIDALDAPAGALAGSADRLAGNDDIDGVGVELRKFAEGDPTAARDFGGEVEVVRLIVGRHVPRGHGHAVYPQLDLALSAGKKQRRR